MATAVQYFGGGYGYIYIVDVDGSTILKPLLNTPENARKTKIEAVGYASVGLNRLATGTITFVTVTGVGQIRTINVNGLDLIDATSPISFTGATSTSALAALVVTAINNYGIDYNAHYTGAVVTLVAKEKRLDLDNHAMPTVTISANATYTSTAVTGGSDATETYDTGIGHLVFLNADFNSVGCGGSTTLATPDSLTYAVDITEYIVPRNLNSAIDKQSVTIVGGKITHTRKAVITRLVIDTEAAAATDNLETIGVVGCAEADIIICVGADAGRVTSVKDGTGNIELQSAVTFATDAKETAIGLQLIGTSWYEIFRSTQAIGSAADFYTAGLGIFGVDTFTTAAIASGAAVTYNGGTASKYLELTGTVALGADSNYQLGTGTAGDEFIMQYNASTTVGVFDLDIFGIVLTAAQALAGGLIVHAKYDTSWHVSVYPNLDATIATPYTIPTEMYKALSVTAAKVEANLATETITRRVSFESGEECDNKVVMGYPGTVTSISFSVDKVIAGTDNGTITPKRADGSAMTGGLITVTAASALDTIFGTAAAISALNNFVAGDALSFTTAKTTKGGFGTLSIKVLKS